MTHIREHPAAVAPASPGFSLLRISVPARLAGALSLLAGLWLTVLWALN